MRSNATSTLPSLGCASALFALALILLAPAAYSTDHTDCANAVEKGVATASQEDFAKAFQLCKPLAEQGDADAQNKVGWSYAFGKGVPQDYTEAVKWFQLAAEQGWVKSQMNLGFMYRDGNGVPQNFAEAAKWYRMAADQGLAPAQFMLGLLYDQGKGVPQNNVEAAKWYGMAADQGFAEAKLNLGLLYDQGLGGFPLEDFPAVGEPPRVMLVDPGEGEKSELRYRFSAGSIHEMVMTMTMRMLGVQGRAIPMPGIRVAMVVEVLEANEDQARIYMSIPNDPDLVGTEGAPPELVAKLRENLRVMSSYRGEFTVTSLGVTEETEFQIGTVPPGLEQVLKSMDEMAKLYLFPEEPVGVGARWKILERQAGPPMTLYQLTSLELLQRAGSSVTLGMKMEQLIPKQMMVLPETPPGAPVDVSAEVAGIGQGDGEMTLDLHSPAYRARISAESVIRTTVRAGDEVDETVMNMALLLEVEPRTLEADETPLGDNKLDRICPCWTQDELNALRFPLGGDLARCSKDLTIEGDVNNQDAWFVVNLSGTDTEFSLTTALTLEMATSFDGRGCYFADICFPNVGQCLGIDRNIDGLTEQEFLTCEAQLDQSGADRGFGCFLE